jgi:hypothetical protein
MNDSLDLKVQRYTVALWQLVPITFRATYDTQTAKSSTCPDFFKMTNLFGISGCRKACTALKQTVLYREHTVRTSVEGYPRLSAL